MTDIVIRPWQPGDADALDGLLDADPDPYFLRQRTGRHGMPSRPDRFAVTLVATDATDVVGAVTLFHNRFHPGRHPTLVEVAPGHRRRGIGRRLLAAAARLTPLPMAGKIRDADTAAMAFARAVGAQTYQHCLGAAFDPTDPEVRAWAARHRPHVLPLGAVDATRVVDAMVAHYEWVHDTWSPMGDRDVITALWTDEVAAADPNASSVAMVGDRIAALCLVWVDGARADAVAETAARAEPDGTMLVGACVARSVMALDVSVIEFDGHDDDPHLRPVIDAIPRTRRDPISLVAISDAASRPADLVT